MWILVAGIPAWKTACDRVVMVGVDLLISVRSDLKKGAMPIPANNNLDFIRTVLALGVLAFHTLQTAGISYPQLPWVPAFISISGYLITDSMFRSASYGHFAWKRLLRIGPAFILSLGLVAISGGSVQGALTDWIFMGLRAGGGNGPLWSLSLEEALYVALAVCFALGMYRTRRRALSGLCLIYLSAIAAIEFIPDAATPIISVVLSFASGSFLYLVRDLIPWSRVGAVACLGIVLWLRNAPISGEPRYAILIGPPIAYLLLTLALHVKPVFAKYKSWIGDPSLGIYVYHCPILLWLHDQGIRGAWLFPCTLALAVLLALMSWHAVEKRALGWREWVGPPVRAEIEYRVKLA
jgi:peptidoglycan/LPS O-acetylase OafA/YrhL